MTFPRNIALLTSRSVLGAYLAAHGAQKLFGSFDGPGIKATSAGFDRIGLRPGALFARVAGASELGGGLLTAAGAASPLGPVVLAATMVVASSTHRANGPFTAKGGYELALSNGAAALALAITGPGRFSIDGITGKRPSRPLTAIVVIGALTAAATSLAMVLRAQPPAPAEPVKTSGEKAEATEEGK